MTLAVFAVCERVRLAMGDVSKIGGLWDLVRRAMGSSGLRGIGLSGGFCMTTLGSGYLVVIPKPPAPLPRLFIPKPLDRPIPQSLE